MFWFHLQTLWDSPVIFFFFSKTQNHRENICVVATRINQQETINYNPHYLVDIIRYMRITIVDIIKYTCITLWISKDLCITDISVLPSLNIAIASDTMHQSDIQKLKGHYINVNYWSGYVFKILKLSDNHALYLPITLDATCHKIIVSLVIFYHLLTSVLQ